jgi:hypothetical protein
MINSGEAKQVALGAKLLEQVENHSFQQEYYLVKQPFHNSQPLPPEVGQFDTTNRQTRTGTDSPPGASGVEEE